MLAEVWEPQVQKESDVQAEVWCESGRFSFSFFRFCSVGTWTWVLACTRQVLHDWAHLTPQGGFLKWTTRPESWKMSRHWWGQDREACHRENGSRSIMRRGEPVMGTFRGCMQVATKATPGNIVAAVWLLNVPKGPCVKGFVFRVVLLGGSERNGTSREVFRSLGVCTQRGLWGPGPVLTLFCLLEWGEWFCSSKHSCHHHLAPHSRPKGKESAWSWTGTSQTTSKDKPFLFMN